MRQNYEFLFENLFNEILNRMIFESNFKMAAKLIYRFQFLDFERTQKEQRKMKEHPIFRKLEFWKFWFEKLLIKFQKRDMSKNENSEIVLEILISNLISFQHNFQSIAAFSEMFILISNYIELPQSEKLLHEIKEPGNKYGDLILYKEADLEPQTEPGSLDNSNIMRA